MSEKLRLSGDFDFKKLAKMTPGFIGANLNALTAEAGGAAMRRIYQTLKVNPTPSIDMDLDDPLPKRSNRFPSPQNLQA